MFIRVNGIRASYNWKWKVSEGICGICQQPFEQMCSECEHPIECIPSFGACKHCYHKHCIKNWIATSALCPICRAEWKEKTDTEE
ncbi:anaphase-promoting complex subunit 11 [Nematocida minor]|uniref:anaphase-promoting complex subunit 11 n=1 Tax=Nematocida minor TaxID=1912983 RepID=UPI00222058DD|nr:anaphase-promoting complex subunit 11 [Nematocida minor]KAI5190519.1 anaphase-promoting complex subunit 11 [Nematocida minor]